MPKSNPPVFKKRLPEIITTEDDSIVMKFITIADSNNFLELALDKDVSRFNNFNVKNIQESEDKIALFMTEIIKKERYSYSIFKNKLFIGYYGIWVEDNHPDHFREGIALMPKYRRQGIYTLCSKSMVEILAHSYKVFYLVNNINIDNEASINASIKRGFIQNGTNEIGELRFVKKIF